MTILTAAAVAACVGCAGPVQPEFKSARSHQVDVDFENLVLLAGHGRAAFFPFSTPHCPYYPPRSHPLPGGGPIGPVRSPVASPAAPQTGDAPSESPGTEPYQSDPAPTTEAPR